MSFLSKQHYVIGCLGVGDIICAINALENMGREQNRRINLHIVNKDHIARFDSIVNVVKTDHIDFHYSKWPLEIHGIKKEDYTVFQAFWMETTWVKGWGYGWGLRQFIGHEHMIMPKETQTIEQNHVGISFTVNSFPTKNITQLERCRVIDELLAQGKRVTYFGYNEKVDFFLKHRYGEKLGIGPQSLEETFKAIGTCEHFIGADSGMAWFAAFQRIPTTIMVSRTMTKLPKTFGDIPWVTIKYEEQTIEKIDGIRRILLMGSGFGVQEWYNLNKEKLNFFHELHAINSAMRVFDRPFVHHVSTDFYQTHEKPTPEIAKLITETVCGNALKHPLFLTLERGSQTMFVDACCHLFNKYQFDCQVYVIGCDFDYSGPTTHFYGKGGLDPLRLGKEKLVLNLKILGLLGIFKNLSGNPKSLLPFEQVKLPE